MFSFLFSALLFIVFVVCLSIFLLQLARKLTIAHLLHFLLLLESGNTATATATTATATAATMPQQQLPV